MTSPLSLNFNLWHNQLGHPSFKILLQIIASYKLPLSKSNSSLNSCNACFCWMLLLSLNNFNLLLNVTFLQGFKPSIQMEVVKPLVLAISSLELEYNILNPFLILIGAFPCGHMAGHLCYTWRSSISIRTSITRSKCLIRPMNISSRLHCVPLRLHDAFQIGFLTHSHEQSFSSCQRYARWDVTLSLQATCYTLHHTTWRLKWQVNHQVTPTSNPCQSPKGWWLLCH